MKRFCFLLISVLSCISMFASEESVLVVEANNQVYNILVSGIKNIEFKGDTALAVVCNDNSSSFYSNIGGIKRMYFSKEIVPVAGDVNNDGSVSVADLSMLATYILDASLGSVDTKIADVNGDGVVSVADLSLLASRILGETTGETITYTSPALVVKKTNGVQDFASIKAIKTINFNADYTKMIVNSTYEVALDLVKELAFEEARTGISVSYNDASAVVVNAYPLAGVSAAVNGADVVIDNTNTGTEYTITLSGTTSSGSFLYNGVYKTTIALNGVSIINPKGAAIDIECGKRVNLELKKGTENTLVDCADGEQKAALYCKGHLEVDKAGTLTVTGNTAHAISAKEYIQFKKANGSIRILGAKKDGIHCKQYFLANGYDFDIKNVGDDGIQVEKDGAPNDEGYDDGSMIINAGSFTINNTADGGKGLTADGNITISGDATMIDIVANGEGGISYDTGDDNPGTEEKKSYVMYFALPSSGFSRNNYWTAPLYLYKGTSPTGTGTLVATLSQTVTVNGVAYYKYDFGEANSETYYLKGQNYVSGGRTTYSIVSKTFSGPTSGIDYYVTINSSYTTSGTYRVFTYNMSSEGGSSDVEKEGDTYYATCIKADSLLTINGGTITLANKGKMSKSLKANTVILNGGVVTSNISGTMLVNGKDATYCSSVKCVNYIGNGGSFTMNATTGNACRGISADEDITINDGTYVITNSTAGYSGTNDTYTAKGLKADKNVNLLGGNISITMSGTGGKGIKAGTSSYAGTYTQGKADGTGPVLKVSTSGSKLSGGSSSSGSTGNWGPGGGGWGGQESSGSSAKAIKAMGAAVVNGGTSVITTTTDGAEGLESKTSVTINGGSHYFKCYDDCINSSGIVKFAGGNTVCYSYGNDAVDSNYGKVGAITVSGGSIFAYSSKGSPEEGLDCDNNSWIVVTGGIAISAGGVQGGSAGGSIGSSTQGYYIGAVGSSNLNATNYYTLYNTQGVAQCTYKFEASTPYSLCLLTAPNLGKGSVSVKYGTTKPTACDASVVNAQGNEVFFVNPTVTTTGTTATVTAK